MIFRLSKLSLEIELRTPQSCLVLSDLVRWSFNKILVKTVIFGSVKAEIRICPTIPVGHIQHFHCIKVFAEYTASSTLMATCVTLTNLTDWSLVKISVKNAKFWSREWQKSSF